MASNDTKKTITINTSVNEVWNALTVPAIIKQYFHGTDVHTDWKPGNPIRFTGEWKGKTYEDKGTIKSVEKGKHLSYTYWSSMAGIPDSPENYVTVNFDLEGDDSSTKLTLTQFTGEGTEAKKAYASSGDNWAATLKQMKELLEGEKAKSTASVPYPV